jgi:hypothetical protein
LLDNIIRESVLRVEYLLVNIIRESFLRVSTCWITL